MRWTKKKEKGEQTILARTGTSRRNQKEKKDKTTHQFSHFIRSQNEKEMNFSEKKKSTQKVKRRLFAITKDTKLY